MVLYFRENYEVNSRLFLSECLLPEAKSSRDELHSSLKNLNFDFLFVADACFEFELRQVKSYLKINFIRHHFNFYNV